MSERLSPSSALGQLALVMRTEAERTLNPNLEHIVEVCETRMHDEDKDVALLARTVLFQYAQMRGIDPSLISSHRMQ